MKRIPTLILFILITACSSDGESRNGFKKNPTAPPNPNVNWQLNRELKKVSVGLVYKDRAFCSGTIISEEEVLTAAHCLGHSMKSRYKDIKIGFGENLTRSNHTREISEVILHESYDREDAKTKPYWDVAIVRFSGGLPEKYKPAAFFKGNVLDLELGEAYMSGFGLESAFNKKNSQFKSSKGRLSRIPQIGYLEGFMRVEFRERGACFGDSGGGLFVKVGRDLQLIGATSGVSSDMNPKVLENLGDIAVGDQDVCQLGDVTYTNLATYSKWIAENSQAQVELKMLSSEPSVESPKDLPTWCHGKKLSMDSRVFINRIVKQLGVGICQEDFQFSQINGEQKLEIDGEPDLDLRILEFMPFFKEIKISNREELTEFPSLAKHNLLKKITIRNSIFEDLIGFALVPNLEKLSIHEIELNHDQLQAIGEIQSLVSLSLYNVGFESLSPLSALRNLEKLVVSESNLQDIGFIKPLSEIRLLVLSDNQIDNLTPLVHLTQLEEAYLDNNQIEDISVLAELPNLVVLSVLGNPIDSTTCEFDSESPISCDDL